jgi:hypothetical protein
LTPEEVARDNEIRREVQEESPPARHSEGMGHGCSSETWRQAIGEGPQSGCQIAKAADVSQIVVSRFSAGDRDIRMATARVGRGRPQVLVRLANRINRE